MKRTLLYEKISTLFAFAENVYVTTDNDKGNLLKDCKDRAVKMLLRAFRRQIYYISELRTYVKTNVKKN